MFLEAAQVSYPAGLLRSNNPRQDNPKFADQNLLMGLAAYCAVLVLSRWCKQAMLRRA
jgi:hypothetical protein